MASQDPLSKINPKTVGFGKSGAGSYKKDDKYSYHEGTEDVVRKLATTARYSQSTANLSRENLQTIMEIIGEIVGNKADKYHGLNRYDEEKFRHRLEVERQHGRLSDADIKDAWKVWKNFDK